MRRRRSSLGLCLSVLLFAPLATAAPMQGAQDAVPSDAALDGDEIYRRVLRNRLRSYVEESTLVSGDRGGSEQEYELVVTWKGFREGRDGAPPTEQSVLSKTMVRYTAPFDLRDTGYLILHHDDRPSDQFVYLPSYRRVRRVNLRGQPVFGTDFSFDDVVPDEFEDAEHKRIADEVVQDRPCFVVELVPRVEAGSDYTKLWIYVEKQRYVPLRTRYWNLDGIEVKEMNVDAASIREFDGVFIPMSGSMRNLRSGSYTRIQVQRLEANPELSDSTFDLRRLIRH